ncbi:MAG: sigma-70 family RNA polymerase sigma factor [Polyangiales bacterium]
MKTPAGALTLQLEDSPALDVEAVHAAHGDFVWASLQRLGARDADLEDRFQEVFLVVHQRGGAFEGRSRITTWLFGICLRVMAAHRRRAWVRRERASDALPEHGGDASPDHDLEAAEARRRLAEILDAMDLDRRAVFVMAVLEEMPADEIATIVGVPVGTVYSRLHAARALFETALRRLEARDAHRSLR